MNRPGETSARKEYAPSLERHAGGFAQPLRSGKQALPQGPKVYAGQPAIQLGVREEGWYRLTQREIANAGLSPWVNPRHLQLFAEEEEEEALLVAGEEDGRLDAEDYVEFYGLGPDTPLAEADMRVYWLVEGGQPGKRVHLKRNVAWPNISPSFLYTARGHERPLKVAGPKDDREFSGSLAATEEMDFLLDFAHAAPSYTGNAILEIALRGAASGPHLVRISLNGVEVGKMRLTGQAFKAAKLEIPRSILRDGENLVSLAAEGPATNVRLVDFIHLTYWRTYKADKDSLRFTVPERHQAAVEGFSSPEIRVMDVTDPRAVHEVIGTVEPRGGVLPLR